MKPGFWRVLICTAVCIHSLTRAQEAPQTDTVLARVCDNLTELNKTLPDFVVEEALRSSELRKGRVFRETRFVSEMTCVKNSRPPAVTWGESRHVLALNDKPAPRSAHIKGPVTLAGGFISALESTLSMNNRAYQEFSASGFEPVDGVSAIVLSFVTKEGQTGMWLDFDGKPYASKDIGRIWIDPQTMQVVKFARKFGGNLPGHMEISFEEEFSRTVIDGKEYWLPKTVTASDGSRGRVYSYVADYSKYRRFTVSSSLEYEKN